MTTAGSKASHLLSEGDLAPPFTLPDHTGAPVRLADFAGRRLVLYVYPKDDTSGCTTEAVDFSSRIETFAAAGVAVLGVSPDPVKSHAKFREKHKLDIALASDETKEMLEAYGVWVEKSMYGKRYMGVERTTFLIDADGRIARIWRKVKVPGHAEAVLQAARG